MNPYEKWLGIENEGSAPNYFKLLGVSYKETDREVLLAAAKSQARKIRQYKDGPQAETYEKLIARIQRALRSLSDPEKRKSYLVKLKEEQKAQKWRQSSSSAAHAEPAAAQLSQSPTSSQHATKAANAKPVAATSTGGKSSVVMFASIAAGLGALAAAAIAIIALFFMNDDKTGEAKTFPSTAVVNQNQNQPDASAAKPTQQSDFSPDAEIATPENNASTGTEPAIALDESPSGSDTTQVPDVDKAQNDPMSNAGTDDSIDAQTVEDASSATDKSGQTVDEKNVDGSQTKVDTEPLDSKVPRSSQLGRRKPLV